jgi:hypothetical protein
MNIGEGIYAAQAANKKKQIMIQGKVNGSIKRVGSRIFV